jgi:hypothetical protein
MTGGEGALPDYFLGMLVHLDDELRQGLVIIVVATAAHCPPQFSLSPCHKTSGDH